MPFLNLLFHYDEVPNEMITIPVPKVYTEKYLEQGSDSSGCYVR